MLFQSCDVVGDLWRRLEDSLFFRVRIAALEPLAAWWAMGHESDALILLVGDAFERAKGWIGALSPPDVTNQLEDDSLQLWKSGNAAFMRNWPYAYLESMKGDSSIRNHVGVTVLPMGSGPQGRHADILGGFQLMVSKTSKNKSAAIEMVSFLTSPEIQRVNATTRGYLPTRAGLSFPSATSANPIIIRICGPHRLKSIVRIELYLILVPHSSFS